MCLLCSAVLLCRLNSNFPEVDLTRHTSSLLPKRDVWGELSRHSLLRPTVQTSSLG